MKPGLPVDPGRLRAEFPDLGEDELQAYVEVTRRVLGDPAARALKMREVMDGARRARQKADAGGALDAGEQLLVRYLSAMAKMQRSTVRDGRRPPGRVESVNTSQGGVPKTPVAAAAVRAEGVEGDRQRDLRYHGGPDRAVSLFSLERIEELRGQGHPIAPGTTGENLTVSGIDWALMVPGARVRVGEALLELTKYAVPCRNIEGSFRDGDITRISHKLHQGWSRVYARVLREGRVQAGDPVEIQP
jgi:MOSC domain-containing protein YiiM